MMDRLVLDVMRLSEGERETKRRRAAPARSQAMSVKALSSVPLFASLPKRERRAALRLGDELMLGTGVNLAAPSYRSLQWVVVLDGSVAAYRDGRIERVLGSGEHAGLDEMVQDGPMEVGLVTLAPSRLLVFAPRHARGLLDAAPRLRDRVTLKPRVITLEPEPAPVAEEPVVHGRT